MHVVNIRAVTTADLFLKVLALLRGQLQSSSGFCHDRLDVTFYRTRKQDRCGTNERPAGMLYARYGGRAPSRASSERASVCYVSVYVCQDDVQAVACIRWHE